TSARNTVVLDDRRYLRRISGSPPMPDADAREETSSPARAKKASAPSVEHELQLYYWMKLIRAFEDRVARLSRQNKIFGGVYSGAGQEAICTGICAPLQP